MYYNYDPIIIVSSRLHTCRVQHKYGNEYYPHPTPTFVSLHDIAILLLHPACMFQTFSVRIKSMLSEWFINVVSTKD